MRLKVGVFDVAALVLVAFVVVLPQRATRVSAASPLIDPQTAEEISRYQARLAADPGDGRAAEELAETLVEAGYSDAALRVAGDASHAKQSPTLWRALRGVSTAHADRIEIKPALEWGQQALAACEATPADCAQHEAIRLRIYIEQLRAGLASGIDPKADPAGFREAISRSGVRNIRLEPPADSPDQGR